jgi:hypothetical protein
MKKKKQTDQTENFLAIDLNELEREWTEQPTLYHKWARKLAKARLAMDEKKAELELIVADLDSEIRAHPKKFKLGEKVTEASIKHAILAEEVYTDGVAALNNARYEVNVLEAGVTALEHRKRALEKCVDLYGMDYFSVPRTSTEKGRAAKDKMEKRSARGGYRSDD